ncbi:MAG: thioredoxin domain-containing protein [Bacteroidota bacterium]
METYQEVLQLVGDKHLKGDGQASIELVEFGDYECPFCFNSYYMVNNLIKTMEGDIKYIFVHFPNKAIHENAMACACAAEAASMQGKFWEMHDALFAHQKCLDFKTVTKIARKLELDVPKFQEDMKSAMINDFVKDQFRAGRALGVTGTPAFFINGRKHEGDWTYKSLIADIRKNHN